MGRGGRAGEQHWRRVVAEQKASGLTLVEFCARKGISKNTFYYWQKRLKGASVAGDEPVFLPVTVRAAEPGPGDQDGRIEVMLAGGQVLALPLSWENLAMVVDVLEGRAC